MTDIQIPGPGSAMALAAGAAAVIAGYSANLTPFFRGMLIATSLVFALCAIKIEDMHTKKDIKLKRIEKGLPTDPTKVDNKKDENAR